MADRLRGVSQAWVSSGRLDPNPASALADDAMTALPGETPGLNYVEFMTCLEGDAINFDEYLKDTRAMFDKHMQFPMLMRMTVWALCKHRWP